VRARARAHALKARHKRSVATLHVAPRCHEVLEARRRERRLAAKNGVYGNNHCQPKAACGRRRRPRWPPKAAEGGAEGGAEGRRRPPKAAGPGRGLTSYLSKVAGRERRSGGALCAAQRMRCCALGRGAGAAGCCAQLQRSAAALHVAPRCYDVMEARRRERRSGGALCAARRVRCCAGGRGTGAAGCCAHLQRSAAALHVAPRCYDVMEARRRERRNGGALCAAQRMRCCALGRGASAAPQRRTSYRAIMRSWTGAVVLGSAAVRCAARPRVPRSLQLRL
jgi:hypothetical protein